MLLKQIIVSILLLLISSCELLEQDAGSKKVTGVSFDRHVDSVELDKSIALAYSLEPADADNQTVSWSNSDETVTLLTSGVVKGLKIGRCRVTIKTADGGFADTCQIKVIPRASDVVFIDIPLNWLDFKMGSTNGNSAEQPVHAVNFTHPLKMSVNEITNAQFCNALNYALEKNLLAKGSDGQLITPQIRNSQGISYPLINLTGYYNSQNRCAISYQNGKFTVASGMNSRPVSFVSWYGAAFYCNMLSLQQGKTALYDLTKINWPCTAYGISAYRLPTEAEWEYSASYNDKRIYPWGSGFNPANANCLENSGSTTNVTSYPGSKLGLYDLAGNVSEWCQDWYYNKYYQDASAQQNPVGPAAGTVKVLRGGSWFSAGDFLRCQARDFALPQSMLHDYGFRVVMVKVVK